MKLFLNTCVALAMILGLFSTFFAAPARPAAASADPGVIAYVRPNDVTGDEIHIINPDGTGDGVLWNTGVPGLASSPEVAELAWKPDSSELAFWSRFQEDCSFYNGDIYAILPNGGGFHRVTAPPACGANPGLPTGTVKVPLVNFAESGTYVVYLQGAPKGQLVTLGPGEERILTFTDVMDFGPGVPQWVVAVEGEWRITYVKGHADVIPNQTVQTDDTFYFDFSSQHWGWNSPTYSSDGSQMAYFFGSGAMYTAPSNNKTPGGVGSYMLNLPQGTMMPGNPNRLQWGSGPRAHQLLYQGFDWDYGDTIYLVNEGDNTIGVPVVSVDPNSQGLVNLGLTWLPDGSGFLFSASESQWIDYDVKRYGNIFEYNLDTRQITRITNNTFGYPRELTVSPDGAQIVYEFQDTKDWADADPQIDLHIINRDGTGDRVLVENALSPAWSPAPLPHYSYVLLPAVLK